MVKIITSQSDNIPEADLALETEIVWVYDRSRFPFVRESFAPQSSARWPAKSNQDDRVIVGYGLARKRRTGATYFRQFYVMRRDSAVNGLPSEAVDPLTVEVGVPGRKTARCSELMTPNDKRYVAKIFREKNAPKKKKKT